MLFVAGEERKVKSVSWHKAQARVFFEGIDTLEAAESLKWAYVTVPRDHRPKLAKGEFVAKDLIGLEALTKTATRWERLRTCFPLQPIPC